MSSLAFQNNVPSKLKPQDSLLSILHSLTHFIGFSSLHIFSDSRSLSESPTLHFNACFLPPISHLFLFSHYVFFFSSSQIVAPCTASFFSFDNSVLYFFHLSLFSYPFEQPSDVLCLGFCTSPRKEYCCLCFFRTSHAYLSRASICCPGTCIVCPSTPLR